MVVISVSTAPDPAHGGRGRTRVSGGNWLWQGLGGAGKAGVLISLQSSSQCSKGLLDRLPYLCRRKDAVPYKIHFLNKSVEGWRDSHARGEPLFSLPLGEAPAFSPRLRQAECAVAFLQAALVFLLCPQGFCFQKKLHGLGSSLLREMPCAL